MAKNIRLAIIGCGKMGSIHLKAARQIKSGAYEDYYKNGVGAQLDRLRLVGLADPSFGKKKKDEAGDALFADYKQLLDATKVDAAIIATPSTTHFDIAKDMLERGIHLLIEKPVACSAREISSLRALARDRGLFILPGHVERYNPVTLDIKEYLQYKVYGRVREYQFTRTSRRPTRVPDSIVIDKLIHDLDLLLFFFGKPKIEDASFERDSKGRVVELDLRLSHRNGTKGRILSSWRIPKKERSVRITAERGEIMADFLHKNLLIRRYNEFSKNVTGYANNQVKDQIADFIGGIFNLAKPLVSINDACAAGRIIDTVERLAGE